MSKRPSGTTSPSNSSKPTSTRVTPEASKYTSSSTSLSDFGETPQSTAEQTASLSQSTPTIVVTASPTEQNSTGQRNEICPDETEPGNTSQPQQESGNTRPANMSSASSSPGSTSTAGSSSGSNVQLPYAPFPYPIPANTRGSGQQGK